MKRLCLWVLKAHEFTWLRKRKKEEEDHDDDDEEALSPTDRWWIKKSLHLPTKTHTQTDHEEKRSDCLLRTGRETPKRKKKNHTQNGPICRQHLPFVLFPPLLSYFVVLDLVITQTIQTPLSLYCYKNSPKNMIPPLLPSKNLKISQSLMLSITHSLTHKCFLMSHTSSARWCFLWNKAKIQTWWVHSITIANTVNNWQHQQEKTTEKRGRGEAQHTHTHTHTKRGDF